ncbi:hypothetical protein CONPUDRAFT_163877 [Coniophora puteana RWD-64-598 SS2]|uniref:Uncharacterized protein n=1 Tax=Coniophora puteana (strain RWD-64-598) TaxID=741705 RepID=A0A5M3MUJ9_CONPW|nr:uncharacterized protein CONPUDRAFT_163877 [Coniophora puteana RWD-64-598 SS2]EIW82809.1 hypothetical protein CONPUDRAFT_163877 [Coniophora puteana RWD-64-598 SS2]
MDTLLENDLFASTSHPHTSNQPPDVIAQIRLAASTPSALTQLLEDELFLRSLSRSHDDLKGKARARASADTSPSDNGSKHHTRTRTVRPSRSIMGLVLAEEEKQAHHLKTMLRTTVDRLEASARLTTQASSRAELAERRARDMTGKLRAAEDARRAAELDATRAREETRRAQMQIESLEREVKRLKGDVGALERQRREADEDAARSRETARGFQREYMDHLAREEGREAVRLMGLRRILKRRQDEEWEEGAEGEGDQFGRFEEGRAYGFEEGRDHGVDEGRGIGFIEGRRKGRKMGFKEGLERGRKEGTDHAADAFDRFVATEMDGLQWSKARRKQDWPDIEHPSPVHPRPPWLGRHVGESPPKREDDHR